MQKRNLIIIISAAFIIILITILAVIFLLLPKKPTTPPKESVLSQEQLLSFSNNFIKDYSTYSYANPTEYNDRLKKYISPEYLATFSKKYFITDQAKKNKAVSGLKSAYYSSNMRVLSSSKTEATVEILYTALEENPAAKKTSKAIQRDIKIDIKKENGQLYVSSFGFSTVK